ncbi:MAG: DegT/DnrJ/EryC1/StrS family aminotransferase [Desulfatibacillaceae bacterium]|nr:DegT/DnrJ/EryC1/StrS family aminotransferase [Desulfatibacillaceae bacterium]
MQFIDLAAQQKRIRKDIDERIAAVLDSGQYIMGKNIAQLEEQLAQYTGTRHAIGCSSGTDALLLALMAYGVGPGDAILTTPFTFIATAEVIALLGATPVFVDIDSKTYNICPQCLKKALHALALKDDSKHPLPESAKSWPIKPRGIIAVDLFGLPADYEAIEKIAAESGLFLIEDAAQSFGGTFKGRQAGSFGQIGCTSFFPAKPLGCYGDGGACFTDDDELADVMRSILVHGKGEDKYANVRIGINGRLDTIQAAVLQSKMTLFPEEVVLRQQKAQNYKKLLGNEKRLVLQTVPEGFTSVWAQYCIMAQDNATREKIMAHLKTKGIPTAIYYPTPLHQQEAFGYLKYKQGDFAVSENCASRIFAVPMHPYITDEDQKLIASAILEALNS